MRINPQKTGCSTIRLRRWTERSLAAAGLIGILLGAGITSAVAKPYENVRFHESFSEVIDDFCGDLSVRLDLHDHGHIVFRPAGPDRLARYTATHHGGATYTNLVTGESLSITWDYLNQDVRVTDNGDGTYTILFQIPGPERVYGPDGEILFSSGGTFRMEAVLDHAGTPSDPADDTFIGEEVISEHGGQPQDPFNFCESFRTLTA